MGSRVPDGTSLTRSSLTLPVPGGCLLGDETCFVFVPPHPVKKFYYKCDKHFHLDDLILLYQNFDNYAIVLTSGNRTEFYLHSKNETTLLKRIEASLPNQHKAGGFSAARFGRIRDEKIGWYVTKIIDFMCTFYLTDGTFRYAGLIVAGPAEMKDLVLDDERCFRKVFSPHVVKTVTISEITTNSIQTVIQLAADVIQGGSTNSVRDFEAILSNPATVDLIVFGEDAVFNQFTLANLKTLYMHVDCTKRDNILAANTIAGGKTKINLVTEMEFKKKYGCLVGIRYFANGYDEDDFDN